MVVLHVKATAKETAAEEEEEEMEFLYQCPAAAAVGDVAAAVAGISRLQSRLLALSRRLRGFREIVSGEAAAVGLERALSEAEAYASKEQVQHNRFLSPRALRDHIKNIEKAAAAALQECPEGFHVQQQLSENKHESVQLWWAGKELVRERKLCDYVGANDKTKIVIRLKPALLY